MTKRFTAIALATLLATTAAPALAQSQGDMTLGFGVHFIDPVDSFSPPSGARVGENARPSLTFEYFVADNIGIEVLAAWPFEHDLEAPGAKIGSTKHLPPTVSVQYHFSNASSITPFVGLGLNYTYFWDEKLAGGVPVSLDPSFGVAVHAGVDLAVSDRASLRADVRWIDIETDIKINGVPTGKVKLDPWVYGVAYVMKF